MKFKKFVKSLGADGILYVRENGDRWLSSGSIFMKVPEDIRTVTACDSASMLSLIENIINYDTFSQPCELVEAVMPVADGVIKDCVRISPPKTALIRPPSAMMVMLLSSVVTLWKCSLTRRFPHWLSRDL